MANYFFAGAFLVGALSAFAAGLAAALVAGLPDGPSFTGLAGFGLSSAFFSKAPLAGFSDLAVAFSALAGFAAAFLPLAGLASPWSWPHPGPWTWPSSLSRSASSWA